MTIEFDIDLIRQKVRTAFISHGLDRIIEQECNKIVEKHKRAAQEELHKFVAIVLVSERMLDCGMTQHCKITLPDLDNPVQAPSAVT